MKRLKFGGRLVREFFQFARENKAWWILPILLVLTLAAILVFASKAVAPFIYPLF